MPGQTRPVTDERDSLMAFLEQRRYLLKLTGYGLTPEQLRATPSASELSVGGVIKHCAHTEAGWIDTVLQRPKSYPGKHDWDQHFDLDEGETLADILAFTDRVAAETTRVVSDLDLDHQVPIDKSVPWNPQDHDHWTLRWVLLHLIEEIAHHTGHADIIRQSVDGATAYSLMAAAEGWPANGFVTPWQPGVPAS
jgi:uncharacterized damage-inducible protein DinB